MIKDTYLKAINQLSNKKITPEDLFDLFSEHIQSKNDEIAVLNIVIKELRGKHERLLNLVSDAHQEFNSIRSKEI